MSCAAVVHLMGTEGLQRGEANITVGAVAVNEVTRRDVLEIGREAVSG